VYICNEHITKLGEKMGKNNKLIKINKRLINKSEIARILGISQPYISLLLSGKRKNEYWLQRIIEILNKEIK